MKARFFRTLIFTLSAIFLFAVSYASTTPVIEINPAQSKQALSFSKSIKIADVEHFLGRKMTFGEKIAFKLNKKKAVEKFSQFSDADEMDGLAVAGFVTSLFVAPVGLVLSAISLSRINKNGTRGRGFAIAGLIIGIVFTALLVVALI